MAPVAYAAGAATGSAEPVVLLGRLVKRYHNGDKKSLPLGNQWQGAMRPPDWRSR